MEARYQIFIEREFLISTTRGFPKDKFQAQREFCIGYVNKVVQDYVAGADPGFFSGGGAPLRNDVTDSELKNF